MNRVVVWTALLATTVGITGCPIFPDQTGCTANRDCADGFVCDLGTNTCVSNGQNGLACYAPSGCTINETCGSDGYCHTGDCSFWGCVNGYYCGVSAGAWTCSPPLGTGGAYGTGGSATGGISFGGSPPTGGTAGAAATAGFGGVSPTGGAAGAAGGGGMPAAAGTSPGGSSSAGGAGG